MLRGEINEIEKWYQREKSHKIEILKKWIKLKRKSNKTNQKNSKEKMEITDIRNQNGNIIRDLAVIKRLKKK